MKTDLEIQQDVINELKWKPLLNASEIGVAVKNGVVTLSGTVDTYSKKNEAEAAAKNVLGVKAVAQEIEVKISSIGKKTDGEIAEAVLNALKWDTSVPNEKIKVKVENGWVTLEGEVLWDYQRTAAKDATKNLTGVRGINNLIAVKPSAIAKDIKENISAAFLRSATLDSQKIQVEIHGNKVILSGKVRAWAEREEAANVAWNAPGITSVENKIAIDTEVYAY